MVVKLGYGVADLMYYHFLRPRLGLDYGLHTLNVDVDVLEMEKYVKNNKIILVYVEHGSSNVDSSIFVTPKKGVAIAVDNHLRKAPIELIIPTSYVEGPIVVKSVDEHFEDLDEILGPWPNQILTAVGVDANNVIYPLAYAIVEAESKASWCWFLKLLGDDLGRAKCDIQLNNICEVFDRQPPKKRNKSYDEISSESCSSCKLSRKGKSIKYSKYGNLGHNKKGYRGQGGVSQAGGSSQARARQAAGVRNVFGQAVGARNSLSQAGGSSQPSATPSTTTGARNASSQVASASHPSAASSTESQGPTQHNA
nr:transposase, mutator type [Tanacetum cinerariifolium]